MKGKSSVWICFYSMKAFFISLPFLADCSYVWKSQLFTVFVRFNVSFRLGIRKDSSSAVLMLFIDSRLGASRQSSPKLCKVHRNIEPNSVCVGVIDTNFAYILQMHKCQILLVGNDCISKAFKKDAHCDRAHIHRRV